jgi:hypothetical protein
MTVQRGFWGLLRADAGFTSCRTDGLAGRESGKNDGIAWQWLEKDGHMANPG